MKETVSIIVPVYNVEKYLEECVDSIINQTYKNLEIILIDDGSTDRSSEICDRYAKADDRILVIHQKNGGLSDARNTGLDNCSGDFIMFVDSDDRIKPETVEIMYKELKDADAEICIGGIQQFGNKTEPITIEQTRKYINGTEALNEYFAHIAYYVVACGKLYKKECFNNLRFDTGKIHEDEFILHKLFYEIKKIVCINDLLYEYRRTGSSITLSAYTIHNADVVEAFGKRFEFFIEKKLNILASKTFSIMTSSYLCMLKNGFFPNKTNKREKELRKIYKKCFEEGKKIGIIDFRRKVRGEFLLYLPHLSICMSFIKHLPKKFHAES